MDYSYETIEAKMRTLPDDLQEAMVSFDTGAQVQKIGERHGLLIDQIGALGDVTSYVMLGLIPNKNFVPALMKKAEVDEKTATQIGKEINDEVFGGIRESLKKIEEKEMAANADFEKAGNMSVEKSTASADVVSNAPKTSVPSMTKEQILDEIENPPAFVDRLLAGTSVSMNETVVKSPVSAVSPATPSPKPAQPPVPPAPSGPKIDPYREPIE